MGRGRVVGVRVRSGKGELHLLRVRVKAHPHKTDSSTLTETKGRPTPHISSIIEWRRAAGYRRRYQHSQAWTLCSSLKQKPWVLKHLCLPEVLTNLSSWGAWEDGEETKKEDMTTALQTLSPSHKQKLRVLKHFCVWLRWCERWWRSKGGGYDSAATNTQAWTLSSSLKQKPSLFTSP